MPERQNVSSGKIRSLDDLKKIKERVLCDTGLREDGYKACVTVHLGTCGIASGAREILSSVMDELSQSNRKDIRVATSGCIGVCSHEPAMTVEMLGSESVLYGDLDREKVLRIIRDHVLNGKPVPEFAVTKGS